jgi:cardiolipin synthase
VNLRLLGCSIVVVFLSTGCSDDRPTEKPYRITHEYSVRDREFTNTVGSLLGPPLVHGNEVVTLVNGDQIFPAMLEAIHNAKKTITFETYVYWRGDIGRQFTDALSERAQNGVKVHAIIDVVGSDRIDHHYFKQMTDAGVEVIQYHALRWYDWTSTSKLNYRTHRKLLIVDGEVGFTGGVGIADEWNGNADSKDHWRDNHYRVRGPCVAQLQAAFADKWKATTVKVLHGDDYFPEVHNAGDKVAQVFKSSAKGGSESMQLLYLISFASAQKNIRLASAYFVPDDLTIHTLIEAAQRGVKVQIIVPGPDIDIKVVRRASRARWGDMLKAGIEIYEYQPTMYHTKLLVVDDRWSSIGSANLDERSFRLNAEANLNVMDQTFAAEQIRLFDNDLAHSKQITLEQWEHRPGNEKFMENFSTMFGWLM